MLGILYLTCSQECETNNVGKENNALIEFARFQVARKEVRQNGCMDGLKTLVLYIPSLALFDTCTMHAHTCTKVRTA